MLIERLPLFLTKETIAFPWSCSPTPSSPLVGLGLRYPLQLGDRHATHLIEILDSIHTHIDHNTNIVNCQRGFSNSCAEYNLNDIFFILEHFELLLVRQITMQWQELDV